MSEALRLPDVTCLEDGRVEIVYHNGIHQYVSDVAKPGLLTALLEEQIGRCQCEWADPVDGSIDAQWPAELNPMCVVHAGEKPVTLAALLENAGAVKTWICPYRFGVDTDNDARGFKLALSTDLQRAFPTDDDREVWLLPIPEDTE